MQRYTTKIHQIEELKLLGTDSNHSVQIQIKLKFEFEFVVRDTEESEVFDLVAFGYVTFSVETVLARVYRR